MMLKTFAIIFTAGGLFGLWSGLYGAGLLSFAMIGLVSYAERVFAAQDREYNASPASAIEPLSTLDLLDKHGSEVVASRFHAQNSESDLENKT